MAHRTMLEKPGDELRSAPSDDALTPSRYRHPGDALRLIGAGIVASPALVLLALFPARLIGASTHVFTALSPATTTGRLVAGLLQLAAMAVALAVVVAPLRHRRYRLLTTLVGGGAAAALLHAGATSLLAETLPPLVRDLGRRGSWIAAASFPSPAFIAAGAAVVVILGPWLTRPWRRAVVLAVAVIAVLRVLTGTAAAFDVVLACTVGVVVGAAVLVVFGAPNRRIGADVVAALLTSAGVAVSVVRDGPSGKGSRLFLAETVDGGALFVKVRGRDERDADLLYRTWRLLRLRGVGDLRPAGSLRQAVEHEALVGLMAERGHVRVPHVERVAVSDEGTALLAMERIPGRPLNEASPNRLTDDLLGELWSEVGRLHDAGIAHRSLHTGNLMVDGGGHPWLVDFSFSELAATDRQKAIDVAELLASLAVQIGPERAAATAVATLGAAAVGAAVPLVQPLALSATTRKAAGGDLVKRTRSAAASASDEPTVELVQLQRVRGRTLLMIAVLTGAFYFILPQLAQAGSAWKAFKSASFGWLVLVVAMSVFTYVAAGIGMLGTVPNRLRVGPTVLVQFASSFVNRVTPASIGGMALNARYLEKSGVDGGTAIAGVGVNSLAGGVVHLALIVVFFAWSGSAVAKAFKLPSGSKLLLGLAVIATVVGVIFTTRWGRRTIGAKVVKGARSAVTNLRAVAKSPTKLGLLFGGSTLTTLCYIAAFYGAVSAFHGGLGIATAGTVYLGASAVAAAAPTPGNLGALEAALVAGLTGVGMDAGPAVSTVLTYRLATYWLPIVPGWLSWTLVQRWNYV